MTEKSRNYIVTIIFKPEAKVAEVTKSLTEALGDLGKIEKQEELTLKRLAYTIAGVNEAPIHQLTISGSARLASILSEELRLQDQVLRYLVTVVKKSRYEHSPEVKETKKEVKT